MKTCFSKKLVLCAATLTLGILGHTTGHAQFGGVPLWTNLYHGPGIGSDEARAIAVDSSGNVIVTGHSTGSAGDYDYATIKYSSAGAALWTNRYNGLGNTNDSASAVAVDSSGNVVVTGYSTGSAGDSDYATIKYSAAGVPLWTNCYNGPGNGGDVANAMALDRNGNVFVTGYSTGTNGFWDYATVAYSSTGVPLWTNRYNGPGSSDNIAHAVAVDGRGNVIVTGHSASSAGDYDYATIAYSRAGVALWTNRYSGPGNLGDIAWAVAVDRTGGVFVTGQSITTNVFDGHNYVTIKYSGTGVPLWTNRYLGPASGDAAEAVAVDGNGDVIVTGTSLVTNFVYDYATIKYSGAGVPLWTNRYHGPGISDDYASAVAVDGNGNVFVTGQSYNHYATIAYSSAGTALWTNRYDGGNGGGFAWAMVVDGSGNVFVTGYSAGSNGYTDYATIKYSAVPPSLSIARTATNTVAVSWPSPSTDFTLQQNTSAAATVNWSNVVATPSDDGTTKTLVVDPLTGNRFYRLFHP